MILPWRVPSYGPPIYTSLTEAEARELQLLAIGKRVLEIGSAYGYSTVLMALMAEFVVSVDSHFIHQSADEMIQNLIRFGVSEKVLMHMSDDRLVLPQMRDYWFDLAFVDGDHTRDGLSFDLEQVQRLVAPGGMLAFHDWDESTCPDVRAVLEAWRKPNYIVDTLAVYRL